MKRVFTVKAVWDSDAGVFVSESDVIGLHVEAKTLKEFQAVMHEFAAELIVANHMSVEERETTPVKDLIPAIVFQPPSEITEAA